jgi:LacI family transcriptional regulator
MSPLDYLKINTASDISIIAQLIEQITWLIASGELKTGDQLPPIRLLAKRHGIHMHTVRVAYQRLEELGLVSIQRGRGTIVQAFDPLEISKRKQLGQSQTFAVLVPGFNLVYQPFIEAVEQTARENSCLPLFSFCDDSPEYADQFVNKMIAKQTDGFIIASIGMTQVLGEGSVQHALPPIVFVDSPDMSGDCVLCDNQQAAYLSTQHLLEHGHRQIGLITSPRDWPNVAECYQGYCAALEQYGIRLEPEIIAEVDDFQIDSGYQGAMQLFQQKSYPSAVFTVSDSLAVGAIRALNQLGLSVPGQVALTSFNDSLYTTMTYPAITSSRFPAYQIGLEATKMLLKRIHQEPIDQNRIVLQPTLVIRQSCGCS